MTRHRQPERQVLDTLVDAGVARSRSDALAWCVRLVGEHADDWLAQLREEKQAGARGRSQGPELEVGSEPGLAAGPAGGRTGQARDSRPTHPGQEARHARVVHPTDE